MRLQESDVAERVAVDDDVVGRRARRDDAELIAAVRRLGIDQGRAADDVERRQQRGAQRELTRLVVADRAQIGAMPESW